MKYDRFFHIQLGYFQQLGSSTTLLEDTNEDEQEDVDDEEHSENQEYDPTCRDEKNWCRFADCALENVKRNCKKSCNVCQ